MNDFESHPLEVTRRQFLGRMTTGAGSLALAALLNQSASASIGGTMDNFHRPARVKRVIHLCMAGGPSHLESLDYKPELAKLDGQPMPESVTKGQPIAQLQGAELKCMGPQHPFAKYGESQQELSTLFPHIGSIADDICIVRSMQTEQINHDPAHTFMNTGTAIPGRPSMGSWVLYGLGAESSDLPGYVVLVSEGGGQAQPIAARQWHSGFLPSKYQGVQFHSIGDPVHYVNSPEGYDTERQRGVIDAVRQLNEFRNDTVDDPEIATRISQYEMAFNMQTSVPDLMDLSDEPEYIFDLYGTKGGDGSYAANCLLARRLAERGVRFIQLYHRGWDHHGGIKDGMKVTSELVDRGTAALIKDLKQRGMFDETLIIWGGEFGRTPMAQGSGRDHHIRGFSIWLAGGGIKGGMSYGNTDDFGYFAVDRPVHVHDLHATMLHLLGIEHERLTFRFQGRDYRLTDVHGNIVHDILA
jgi:hypothetical protein